MGTQAPVGGVQTVLQEHHPQARHSSLPLREGVGPRELPRTPGTQIRQMRRMRHVRTHVPHRVHQDRGLRRRRRQDRQEATGQHGQVRNVRILRRVLSCGRHDRHARVRDRGVHQVRSPLRPQEAQLRGNHRGNGGQAGGHTPVRHRQRQPREACLPVRPGQARADRQQVHRMQEVRQGLPRQRHRDGGEGNQ